MGLDVGECRGVREPRHIVVAAVVIAPSVVGARDLLNVFVAQRSQTAVRHRAEPSGVDEQHFALTFAVLRVAAAIAADEPEANGDAGVEEELVGHCDDAVHEVGLDELAADLALATGLRR